MLKRRLKQHNLSFTFGFVLIGSLVFLNSGEAVSQTAPPKPGSPDFLLRTTTTLIDIANTQTPIEAVLGINQALDQLRANIEAHINDSEAFDAEVDAFGSLISGMAGLLSSGGDAQLQALVAAATQRQMTELEKLLSTVPTQAQAGILKAMDASQRGHENALAALRGEPIFGGNQRGGVTTIGGPSGVGSSSGIGSSGGLGRPGGIGPPGGIGSPGRGR